MLKSKHFLQVQLGLVSRVAALMVKGVRTNSCRARHKPDACRACLPGPLFHLPEQGAANAPVLIILVYSDAHDIFHMGRVS